MNINRLSLEANKLPTIMVIAVFYCLSGLLATVYGQEIPNDSAIAVSPEKTTSGINPDSLLHFAKSYLGTPYKLAGKNPKGFDCSGFVHYVYKKFNIVVPYSCPGISSVCHEKIKKSEVQKGDLLFFKGSNIKSKAVGHISIVYAVDENGIQMIHSCRRGVILETLDKSKYYKSRYLYAKRIL